MSSPGSSRRSSRTLVSPPSPLSNTPMGRLSMAGHRPFHRQGDQAVDELGQGGAFVLHQLGVHADGGEAGHGVDLVDEDPAGAPLYEEVAAGQPLAAQGGVSPGGQLLDLVQLFFGQAGGDDGLADAVLVL